ncbi:MAG: nicotinate-nucleotide diphosphorylase (carboxylating) [Candidatus Omnitrophica bacterium CG11_big_fil_rev_8_21_14_0_20_45_26]|uniref:Probable nicotinate-nucleotide pyrophosphorylase [carboxylating] n=1 Tax=Candidatus Abzuiibacterium crystallinum TaxID=1974748 RepID=A0A2H0LM04_9BACT|nr:MAG: nicotinate-nucleotide diphosphorylase (carboxylating) [Candidatus Omnitrophica bacterium CG11_big_fil_rev_8_21_14_0_20_45_26]PIW64442.1 MAG: nicotinate-nucleotide diphosphorylase (carboxylating) [Candidatus Omnitrophica bacterium CG12_big_fil_rev_8_21_14_0_65_45_16]
MIFAKYLIRMALKEDIGFGDITTNLFVPPSLKAEGKIMAKADGVLAGTKAARKVFHLIDPKLEVVWLKKDGQRFQAGHTICRVKGSFRSILKAERVVLNFLGHLSGVASQTYQYVQKVRGTKAKIYDTRKTMPLWRVLEKEAVRLGGGCNHRWGLWDQGLFKDNHWQVGLKPEKIAQKTRQLKKYKWVIEIDQSKLKYLKVILTGRPKVILLDNFSPETLRHVVAKIKEMTKQTKQRPLLEASGGITLKNVSQIARTGVDRISIGAITHSAPSIDFSLQVHPLSQ